MAPNRNFLALVNYFGFFKFLQAQFFSILSHFKKKLFRPQQNCFNSCKIFLDLTIWLGLNIFINFIFCPESFSEFFKKLIVEIFLFSWKSYLKLPEKGFWQKKNWKVSSPVLAKFEKVVPISVEIYFLGPKWVSS